VQGLSRSSERERGMRLHEQSLISLIAFSLCIPVDQLIETNFALDNLVMLGSFLQRSPQIPHLFLVLCTVLIMTN